jgi:hypothetical protein
VVGTHLNGCAPRILGPLYFGGTMTAKLDKTIKRELELDGKLYTVAIAPDGIKVTEKGRRNGQEMSWRTLISGDASLTQDLKLSVDASNAETDGE